MPRAVGRNRAKHFFQSCPFPCPGGAGAREFCAGRPRPCRRTRRFGHAALAPCSVFAPRRTTRRQCRDWLSLHRATGRVEQGSAPPCRTGLRRSPVFPRSAHQNGHFPSSWKMSGMPRAVGRNRAKHLPPNQPSLGPGGAGTGKFCAGWSRPCPPPHAAFRTLCPQTGQSVRSEAHYAAAVPRLVRPASGGGPGKTGESAALPRRDGRLHFSAGGVQYHTVRHVFLKERENANGTTGKRP